LIRGRFATPGAVTRTEVGARTPEGFLVLGTVAGDGTYEIRGLPPGTRWTVWAKARGESAWLSATVEADAGAEVDLTLAPK
jgi:hypothetical protein